MTSLHTLEDVAADLKCSVWTIAELVRSKKVACVRINTGDKTGGPIRFTDTQVAQIVAQLTIAADVAEMPRRRKRRTA